MVYIWYHAEGESASWTIPTVPEIQKGLWTYRGRTEHTTNWHIQFPYVFLSVEMEPGLSFLFQVMLRTGLRALESVCWYVVICLGIAAPLLFYFVVVLRPVNYIRDYTTIGFDYLKTGRTSKPSRSLVQETIRNRTLQDDLPPVFPNGWISLLESRMLAKGQVKPVTAVGEEFAVFRSEDGKVHVVDAFCPHLGAHLGIGGRVRGGCLQCPFHGWTFDVETGECVLVPYSGQVPKTSKLKIWESCEVNGMVYIWYHAEGESASWTIPTVPEIQKGLWTYRGRTEHTTNWHIQDVMESGADLGHLGTLRESSFLAGLQPYRTSTFLRGLMVHSWQGVWTVDKEEPHKSSLSLQVETLLAGFRLPFVGFTAKVVQLERDIAIWNNKRFLRKPVLVSEDSQIVKFRRWYSQFFSEHSPTLKKLQSKSMDW